MDNKYTKGKWRVEQEMYIVSDTGIVAEITAPYLIESTYNAVLISASPDMIEALLDARDTLIMCTLIDKSDLSKNSLKKVEAAIEKALNINPINK